MRLSGDQINHILNVIESTAKPFEVEVFLYGSRTKDELKGGDIDLLVFCSEEAQKLLFKEQYKILNELKKSPIIGDRKIDLKIARHDDLEEDPFLKSIADGIVRLSVV